MCGVFLQSPTNRKHIERFMSLCIHYHINALELVGGIASRLASENPRSRIFSPCRGFPFIVGLLAPEAVESPHNRVHCQLNNAVAY